jgi:hypothetical protein
VNKILVLLAGLALAASSAASEKTAAAEKHSSYYAYAGGDSLPEIRWSELHNWERDSDSSVILWTRPSRAYLVTLKSDCWDLSHAKAIKLNGIDAFERRLRPNDTLQFGTSKCVVSDIKAVDLDAMKRDNRAKKN